MIYSYRHACITHPEVSLVSQVTWDLFFSKSGISNVELSLMQKKDAEFTDCFYSYYVNGAPKLSRGAKMRAWYALAFAHPEFSEDELLRFTARLNLSPNDRFLCVVVFSKIPLFEKLIEKYPAHIQQKITEENYKAFSYASYQENLGILNRLVTLMPDNVQEMIATKNYEPFRIAAADGHLSVMEWMIHHAPNQVQEMIGARNYLAFSWAANDGHLHVMEWLFEHAPSKRQEMIAARDYLVVCQAASNGHLHIIEWLFEQAPDKKQEMLAARNYQAFSNAATNGYLLIEWLLDLVPDQVKEAMITANNFLAFRGAASNGHLHVMERLTQHAPDKVQEMIISYTYQAFRVAAQKGHLQVLKWLSEQASDKKQDMIHAIEFDNYSFRIGWRYASFYNAAQNGHLHVLTWLVSQTPDKMQEMIASRQYFSFSNGAKNGHLHVIKWLIEHTSHDNREMMLNNNVFGSSFSMAAENGHLHIMKWLGESVTEKEQQDTTKYYNAAFNRAAENGHLHVMEYLVDKAPDKMHEMIKDVDDTLFYKRMNYESFFRAAQNGHLHILKWLFEKTPDKQKLFKTCHYEALSNGHLAAAKWSMRQAPNEMIKMSKEARVSFFYGAAKKGHLHVLQWIIEQASSRERKELFETSLSNVYSAFYTAALYGHLHVMQWLLTLEPTKKQAMFSAGNCYKYQAFSDAAGSGHLDIMIWLIEQTPDKKREMIEQSNYVAFKKAAREGHLYILKWLIKQAPANVAEMIAADRYQAFCASAENGCLNTMEWLAEHAADKKQEMITARDYAAFRGAAKQGHFHVMKWLMEQVPNRVEEMVIADSYGAFGDATKGHHLQIINYLLRFPSVFSLAELHEYEYGEIHGSSFVPSFVALEITRLKAEKLTNELNTPTAIFDITDPKAAKLCFYMLRHIIHTGNTEHLDEMHFLIEIPSVNALLHTAVTPRQPNELLRLALNESNRGAADILMNIPAVRELAEENDFYRNEMRGGLDLAALAGDRESSMIGLTRGEQKRLGFAIKHYQPMIVAHGGTHKLMTTLRERLKTRYEANPARVCIGNNRNIELPFHWEAWQILSKTLSADICQSALKAYYEHKDHSAWRYLAKPNPWISDNAPYVNRDTSGGWSTFKEYQPLIVMFFLGAIDEEVTPTNGHTLNTRLKHFIDELALIGRSHNWDRTRKRTREGELIEEEYDDLEGDKPSCYSGVKRRLFQSILGHPLLQILTLEDIKQELKALVRSYFMQCISENPNDAIQWKKAWDNVCDTGEGAEALRALNVSKISQEAFINYLSKKYPSQFDEEASFKQYIDTRFRLSEQLPSHAASFGGEINLKALLEPYVSKELTLTPDVSRALRINGFYPNKPSGTKENKSFEEEKKPDPSDDPKQLCQTLG